MKVVIVAAAVALMGTPIVAQSTHSAATFPTYNFGFAYAGGNHAVCESHLYSSYLGAFNKCTEASNQHVRQQRARGNSISFAGQKPYIAECESIMTRAYNRFSGTLSSC